MAPVARSTKEAATPWPLQVSQPGMSCGGLSAGWGGGAGKCQLLLRTPPDTVSIVVPSALTTMSPTSSNCPVTGLMDQRSILTPGAQPPVFGNVSGAGWVNTMSPG